MSTGLVFVLNKQVAASPKVCLPRPELYDQCVSLTVGDMRCTWHRPLLRCEKLLICLPANVTAMLSLVGSHKTQLLRAMPGCHARPGVYLFKLLCLLCSNARILDLDSEVHFPEAWLPELQPGAYWQRPLLADRSVTGMVVADFVYPE